MYLLIAKTPVEIIECYLEIMVRLLVKGVVDIYDGLLIMYHSYKISYTQSQKFRNMFLNHGVLAIKKFFLEYCACLRSYAFLHMYSNFKPDVDYSFNDFKIVNWHYLGKILKIFHK